MLAAQSKNHSRNTQLQIPMCIFKIQKKSRDRLSGHPIVTFSRAVVSLGRKFEKRLLIFSDKKKDCLFFPCVACLLLVVELVVIYWIACCYRL